MATEPRDRLFARAAVIGADNELLAVDLGAIVRRLLLFEEYILESVRLQEFPALVELLGPEAVIDLLDSRALRVSATAWTTAEVGKTDLQKGKYGRRPLPDDHFALATVAVHDQKQYISDSLEVVRAIELGRKTSQRLRLAIVSALMKTPDVLGAETLQGVADDVARESRIVSVATAVTVQRELGITRPAEDFRAEIERVGEHLYRMETNVATLLDLDAEKKRYIEERLLLALSGVNQRIDQMNHYRAVAGFRPDEVPLFAEKLRVVVDAADPELHEKRFDRVVALSDFPDIRDAVANGTVDVTKLLSLRDSDDLREFRRWLRAVDEVSDEEILARMDSFRERVNSVLGAKTTTTLRFLAGVGIDLAAGGLPVGSGLDKFLRDDLVSKPGPVTFIGRHYKSLFNLPDDAD